MPWLTTPLQLHHHTLRLRPESQSFYNYITILYFTSMTGFTVLLQVHHHTVLYVSARGENPSTSTSPYCTLRLCPGSQPLYNYITILYVFARSHNPSTTTSPYCTLRLWPGSLSFYKYITILFFTSLPEVKIPLQVHHHTVLYLYALAHNPSTTTSPYSTSLPGVTILLQLHHHTVLYVYDRVHSPSTSTSPYCTLRLWPGSQSLYKYITILYVMSLPGVTIILQVHHHTVLYVSARGHDPSTSTTPYCTLGLCPGSQSFYKCITILYFTSLPGIRIPLQIHHHTVLYVSARGHNPSTSTTPYCTLGLCPGSQSFYKCITILYFTSLPGIRIPLQIHHHTVLYVSARGHNPSTSTSRYCILRLWLESQSFCKYIFILYFTSLPGATILLQVYHHTVFYVSARGVTILLQVNQHPLLYVSARGHNPSISTSPYCTWCLCPGSQSFYKYITILYFTSLSGVTILLQAHHHPVLYAFARGHNASTSTSPYCTLRLCPGSQSSYKYFTILYFTSLLGVTILLQVHHHTVHYVSARGHNPSTSTSPYCTLRLCPGSQSL